MEAIFGLTKPGCKVSLSFATSSKRRRTATLSWAATLKCSCSSLFAFRCLQRMDIQPSPALRNLRLKLRTATRFWVDDNAPFVIPKSQSTTRFGLLTMFKTLHCVLTPGEGDKRRRVPGQRRLRHCAAALPGSFQAPFFFIKASGIPSC